MPLEKCHLLLFPDTQQVQIIVFPILTLSRFRESRLSASPRVCSDYSHYHRCLIITRLTVMMTVLPRDAY